MTQPTWDIQITTDTKKLDADLLKLETKLSQPELSAWMETDLLQNLQRRAEDRFATEGDDAVGSWDPLEPVTNLIRASKGYPPAHPINVRTGDLKNFMTTSRGDVSSAGGGVQLQYPSDPPTGELREKFVTAQTGKAAPRTPMRPVVALGLTDYNEIMELLSIHITEGLI